MLRMKGGKPGGGKKKKAEGRKGKRGPEGECKKKGWKGERGLGEVLGNFPKPSRKERRIAVSWVEQERGGVGRGGIEEGLNHLNTKDEEN